MLLQGKTVLIVEPEAFSAYALESQFRGMNADRVVRATHVEEGLLLVEEMPEIDLAIVDCDQFHESGTRLAARLREHGIKVVRTVREITEPRASDAGTPVSKPYFMIDIERAVAAQYGQVI